MKFAINYSVLTLLVFVFTYLGQMATAEAFKFSTKKKSAPVQQVVEDEDVEDDDDYIDRQNADLSKLPAKEVLIEGAVCDACIYKIRSVLQESSEVFKVNHEGFKNLYVYFNKGQSLSDARIKELIQLAGYKVTGIKPHVYKEATPAAQ